MKYDPGVTLYEKERRWIISAMEKFQDNIEKAANVLGIQPKELDYKLHGYGYFDKDEVEVRKITNIVRKNGKS